MKGRLVVKEALLAVRPRYNTKTPKEGSTFTLYRLNFCGKVTLPVYVRYLVYNEHDVIIIPSPS